MDAYSLGQQLRQAREAKEITLAAAESTLKIRRHILEGFEQGDFNVADASPVQIRGFIRNYARFLSLEEDRTLQYYDSMLESANRQRTRKANKTGRRDKKSSQTTSQVINPRSTAEVNPTTGSYASLTEQRRQPSAVRRLLNLLLVFVVGIVALGVIAFVALQLIETTPPDSPVTQVAGDGIFADIPPTFTFTPRPSLTPIRTQTVEPLAVQNYAGQPVLVTLEVRQRCWLYFEADGVVQYSGLLRPGEAVIEYPANSEVLIRASNAAALVVTYNGVTQPSYGGRGQRIEIRFRPNGDIEIISGPSIEPTPEFSPTPPFTPTPIAGTMIAELTPSVTPGPSLTPSNTPTMTNTPPASPTATLTPTVTNTPTITNTPTQTLTPSNTPTLTLTPTITPTPSQTAIVPPRISPTPATPVKE